MIENSVTKAMTSMARAMAGAGVIDAIELLHDDVRNDLRMMLGTVAGNVDDAAVFAEAPGKSQAEARQQGRPQFREDDAPENGELRRAEHAARFFIRRSSFQDPAESSGRRTGMPTKTMAMVRPILV